MSLITSGRCSLYLKEIFLKRDRKVFCRIGDSQKEGSHPRQNRQENRYASPAGAMSDGRAGREGKQAHPPIL